MPAYYAAHNSSESPLSVVYSRGWIVLAFESKATRDDFLAATRPSSSRDVLRRNVRHYLRRGRPHSDGLTTIIGRCEPTPDFIPPRGLIGEVYRGHRGEAGYIRDFA